jgi:hypothetical protein
MKRMIIFISIAFTVLSCVSNKTLTNLDTLPKAKREKYLLAQAKEVVLKYGAGYYREYKESIISQGQVPPKGTINTTGENADRIFYHVVYQYNEIKELLEYPFLARVQVWADTGKPSSVFFGNGLGIIIPENGQQEERLEQIIYEQRPVFPLYDWQNGKDETNSEPINKEELIKRGYEKQSDGTWIKVKPDIPPKY